MSELAQAMILTDRAAAKVRKLREGEANLGRRFVAGVGRAVPTTGPGREAARGGQQQTGDDQAPRRGPSTRAGDHGQILAQASPEAK